MQRLHRPFPISLNPQLVNCYDETGADTRRYSNDHVNNYTAANQQATQSVRLGSVIMVLHSVNRSSAEYSWAQTDTNATIVPCKYSFINISCQTSEISISVKLTPADTKFLCNLLDSLKHEKKRRTKRNERMKINEWKCRSRRSRGLKSGSATVSLLGLLVRIPPGHRCLSLVIVVCCQVEVSVSG